MKIGNGYAHLIGREIDAPKTVWMALAVSLANQINGGLLDRATRATHYSHSGKRCDNGIVPQPTRRKARDRQ